MLLENINLWRTRFYQNINVFFWTPCIRKTNSSVQDNHHCFIVIIVLQSVCLRDYLKDNCKISLKTFKKKLKIDYSRGESHLFPQPVKLLSIFLHLIKFPLCRLTDIAHEAWKRLFANCMQYKSNLSPEQFKIVSPLWNDY